MPDSVPLAVTTEAKEWLLHVPSVPGKEPGFSCSPRYGVYNGDELIEEFNAEHYSITHASREAWLSMRAIQVIIGTRPFWIQPDTLEKLQRKTITVIQKDVSRKPDEPKIRSFLVAV